MKSLLLFLFLGFLLLFLIFVAMAPADEPLLQQTISPLVTMNIEAPCVKSEEGCYIFINDEKGHELVRISERTGKVTVAHPERTDEAARQFWKAIEIAVGPRCKK